MPGLTEPELVVGPVGQGRTELCPAGGVTVHGRPGPGQQVRQRCPPGRGVLVLDADDVSTEVAALDPDS